MHLSRSEKFCIQLRKDKKQQHLKSKKVHAEKDDDWQSMFEAPSIENEFEETFNLILHFGQLGTDTVSYPYELKDFEQCKINEYFNIISDYI